MADAAQPMAPPLLLRWQGVLHTHAAVESRLAWLAGSLLTLLLAGLPLFTRSGLTLLIAATGALWLLWSLVTPPDRIRPIGGWLLLFLGRRLHLLFFVLVAFGRGELRRKYSTELLSQMRSEQGSRLWSPLSSKSLKKSVRLYHLPACARPGVGRSRRNVFQTNVSRTPWAENSRKHGSPTSCSSSRRPALTTAFGGATARAVKAITTTGAASTTMTISLRTTCAVFVVADTSRRSLR